MSRADRLRAQALSYAVPAGLSIREMIQEDLDDAMDQLMLLRERPLLVAENAEKRGECYGLARALAIMINPYDFEEALISIRADAVRRWQERNAEPEVTPETA